MPFHGEHSPNPMAAALVSRVLPMFSQLNAALLRCTLASRCHHLIKAFWGWQDQQLPDGTLIWTSQSGQTYVTTPGSALLFPSLCVPTAALVPPDPSLCPATVCRPGGDDAQAATYPRPEPGLLHRRGTPTKSTGPATQRGGTIAGCRERRAAALLGVRQVMDERLGLFPGGQQTAARTSFKMGAAASRSDSTGGAHRDGDSQLRSRR